MTSTSEFGPRGYPSTPGQILILNYPQKMALAISSYQCLLQYSPNCSPWKAGLKRGFEKNPLIFFSPFFPPSKSQGSLCMSAGIKTPKRWELIISNTTFMNFDLADCVAIRTCSGCSRGQGKLFEQIRQMINKASVQVNVTNINGNCCANLLKEVLEEARFSQGGSYLLPIFPFMVLSHSALWCHVSAGL